MKYRQFIAQAKGKIKDNDYIDFASNDKAKKTLESNPRASSQNDEALKKLYNPKIDAPKDMQYERNIVEIAHPNPVIIGPAYDRINSLVENVNERQDIILNILRKRRSGAHDNYKYAQDNLQRNLIRIANYLDTNENHQVIAKLANVCTNQSKSSEFKKQAFWPALAIAATLIGTLYTYEHMNASDHGFEQNSKNLISEIDDLINAEVHWYQSGYTIDADLKQDLKDFRSKVTSLDKIFSKVKEILHNIQKPKDAKELIAMTEGDRAEIAEQANHAHEILKQAIDNMGPYLDKIEQNFSSTSYRESHISNKGFINNLIDKTQILHGKGGLIADDFDDVVQAIAPYKQSVLDLEKIFQKASEVKQDVIQDYKNTPSETPAVEVAKQTGSSYANPGEQEMSEIEKEINSL